MHEQVIKKRDAEATRERILLCAKKLFSDKGYSGASTREIAACANVNSALVARYFGSKKELFEEAILQEFNIEDLLQIDSNAFASQVATLFANKPPKEDFDPMAALVRSAGDPEIGDHVRAALAEQVIRPMTDKVSGNDAEQRAAVLLSLLAGFDLFRRAIGVDALNGANVENAQRILETSIINLLSTDADGD